MNILIVDDDYTGRLLLQKILQPYGTTHVAVDGNEALDAFLLGHRKGMPYDLICMDILLPCMNGREALTRIREWEATQGVAFPVRVLMTSVLSDRESIIGSFRELCDGYLTKPIFKEKLVEFLYAAGLQPRPNSSADHSR